jgi:hypothetical protein
VLGIGGKRLGGEADGVGGVENTGGLALGVLRLAQADFQNVVACIQIARAELEPGHLAPEIQFHEIGRDLVGIDQGPVTTVHPPLERGTHELEANAIPYLILACRRHGDRIADESPFGGELGIDLLGVDADVQPLLLRKELLAAPARDVGLEIRAGRGFALDPDVVGGTQWERG